MMVRPENRNRFQLEFTRPLSAASRRRHETETHGTNTDYPLYSLSVITSSIPLISTNEDRVEILLRSPLNGDQLNTRGATN